MPPTSPSSPFSLRRIAVPAFGPTLVWSVGAGAVAPIVALSATALGASAATAAGLVALMSLAELISAVPAAALVSRVGERRALVTAGLIEIVGALVCLLAPSLTVLALGLVLLGPSASVFLLARQSYLTGAAPVHLRARAMSTLGGVHRIGMMLGPFVAAPFVEQHGVRVAYAVLAVFALASAVLAGVTMDLTVAPALEQRAPVPVSRVVREHRRVFATVGTGVLFISAARAARVVAVPLWAESVGLTPAQVSLVFGVSYAVEVLIFYPAGWLMDRFGRVVVAVPTAVLMGVGLAALPLSGDFAAVLGLALVMAVGNGLGSGIVMTLGADAAPVVGRAEFLGVWRLLSLVGSNGAPLLLAGVTAAVGLAGACVLVGGICVAAGGWLGRWLPEYDPRRGPRAAPE